MAVSRCRTRRAAALIALMAAPAWAEPYPARWFYLQANLAEPQQVRQAIELVTTAGRAGMNGVVLGDAKFMTLEKYGSDAAGSPYARQVHGLLEACSRAGIEVIPSVPVVSRTHGLFAYDPNLAEGFEVRDAMFEVRGGVARLVPDPDVRLNNSGFEQVEGVRAAGWHYQDDPGRGTVIDCSTRRSGQCSLRLEPAAASRLGQCRINQQVTVAPHRHYEVSAYLRTEDLQPAGSFSITVMARTPGGERVLAYPRLQVRPTQSWAQVRAVFNSMRYQDLTVQFGISRARGKAWLDDAVLTEPGMVNLLRRKSCPLSVRLAGGETPLVEGRDFAPVVDRYLGVSGGMPGLFDDAHDPPSIRVLKPLPEGTRLRVSYHHALTLRGHEVSVCMAEPKALEILERQVRRLDRLMGSPKRYLLAYDEIRQAGTCGACAATGLTPGQLLAGHVKRTVAMMRRVRPGVELATWHDMFDPQANARDGYYLVNGTLAGSWDGLPPDVLILNWTETDLERSLRFFADRGHPQVVSIDFDRAGDPIGATRATLAALDRTPRGMVGTMYTTWTNNYRHLAQAAGLMTSHARPLRQ